MELIRALIEKIVLTPREGGGVEAILHGDLARILVLCSTNAEEATPRGTARVAGVQTRRSPRACSASGALVSVACWLRGQDLNL